MNEPDKELNLGLPEGLNFTDHGTYLEFVRRWFGVGAVMITLFALFWDGFLIFWYSTALNDGDLMMILFPLIHVIIGLFITYFAAASWINRTRVLVSSQKIAIRHEPLPWFGAKEVSAEQIQQLYTKERIKRNKNSTSVTYGLNALTQDGKTVKIFTGFQDSDQVLFIEQEIERYLGIQNQPVRGEYR